ncbi:VapE domain-containing protein [Bacillus sp. SCS-151]|uniref:VapE domain-containing protein n=1 Tax=Nanhaiella sioensis TaxID=3115293 RepID=UPI00397BAA2E
MSAEKSPKLQYDGSLTIATGKSRKETNWKNKETLWSDLIKRLSETTRTHETYQEYKKMPKSQQGEIKDIGGFVGGTLRGGRRKTDAVVWRQVLTLDADYIKGDLWTSVEMMYDFACAAYSTHKHSTKTPRLRLVIPLSRPITPDEYQAVSRRIAADLGVDFFDDTTYQPHRLMYWPSTPKDGEFMFEYQDEPWLDPDKVLARYPDWSDPSYWPESSRQQQSRQKLADKQGDPHEKPGMVGAFCRTYSIPEAIESFLTDVYEPAGENRYTYKEGSTNGGLILYSDDKFAYSHHGTDPVGGKLVNAFDLIRLHKYGIRDEDAEPGTPVTKLPSYKAMVEFAGKDEKVSQLLGEEKLTEAGVDFQDSNMEWLKKLKRDRKSGEILSTIDNALIVLENDPSLKGKIAMNEFANRPMILEELPWANTEAETYWSDQDDDALFHYLEKVYGISSSIKVRNAIGVVLKRHQFHPVREYLNGLEWDGLPRLDTVMIDYLGADDSPYTRAVTRKSLTAAVARIMNPGVKFDYMLTLVGSQGVGKSLILNKLGKSWFSDSLTTVQGKEAYEQLQGAWIIEMGELSATRKADVEAIKHFLTKREDIYRVAYGRQTTTFKRQCVFFGTTNDITFLKDKTGNRRFWPVSVNAKKRKKTLWDDMTDHEINQIWAEAKEAYKEGEALYLPKELEEEAMERQKLHTEESEKYGVIQEYLNRPLPSNWSNMDIGARRRYIHGSDFGEQEEGTVERDRVCAMEVWVELFESDPKHLNPAQSKEINDILRRMSGWGAYTKSRGRMKFGKLYGIQRAFVRS